MLFRSTGITAGGNKGILASGRNWQVFVLGVFSADGSAGRSGFGGGRSLIEARLEVPSGSPQYSGVAQHEWERSSGFTAYGHAQSTLYVMWTGVVNRTGSFPIRLQAKTHGFTASYGTGTQTSSIDVNFDAYINVFAFPLLSN